MKQLKELVRPNIWSLAPYSSARNEYSGHKAHVFLDANENPYNKPYNRYPDPLQTDLKARIAKIKGVDTSRIFLGDQGRGYQPHLPRQWLRRSYRPGLSRVLRAWFGQRSCHRAYLRDV